MSLQQREPWSKAEDEHLLQLVHKHGPLNWAKISQPLRPRTGKQCRERYHQTVRPDLNHQPITPEEGAHIESLVRQIGKRWVVIARQLPGRSDNAVKNWWNGSQKRRKRLERHGASQENDPCDDHYAHSLQTVDQPLPSLRPSSAQPSVEHSLSWTKSTFTSSRTSKSPDTETCVRDTASRCMPDPSQPTMKLPPIRTGTSSGGVEFNLPSFESFANSVACKFDR